MVSFMKFNFKIQQYQTDAVNAVVKVFSGKDFTNRQSISVTVAKALTNRFIKLKFQIMISVLKTMKSP